MSVPGVPAEPRSYATVSALARAGLLAALLLPVSWTALSDSGLGPGWTWTLTSAVVVLHALLLPPIIPRQPLLAFGVGSAVMLVLVAGPDLAGAAAARAGDVYAPILLPSSLAWFFLLYEVAARAHGRWPFVALGVGAVGGILTVVRLWDSTQYATPVPGEWGRRIFVLAAVDGGILAAWSLGRYRATRIAWNASLAERAAADERRRIAREMHDVVAHSLAVVVAQAEAGRLAASTRPERAPAVLDTIATTGREALNQMRGLLGVLRDDEGAARPALTPTAEPPAPGLADLPALVEQVRSAGLEVHVVETGTPSALGPAAELTAFRVIQESLTNTVRHAGVAASATVELDWTDGLVVTVTNDGGTLHTPHHSPSAPGRGILGMRERLTSIGGELLEAGPTGRGWRTRARIGP